MFIRWGWSADRQADVTFEAGRLARNSSEAGNFALPAYPGLLLKDSWGPDLAVEILSPNNTRAEIDERLHDFFSSGTQVTWIIHPDEQFVEVCHSPTNRKILGSGALLDGENLLPGFQYPIADLFKEWDWE